MGEVVRAGGVGCRLRGARSEFQPGGGVVWGLSAFPPVKRCPAACRWLGEALCRPGGGRCHPEERCGGCNPLLYQRLVFRGRCSRVRKDLLARNGMWCYLGSCRGGGG